jgi:hypothetical protein
MQRELWDSRVDALLTEVDLRCKLGVLETILEKHKWVSQRSKSAANIGGPPVDGTVWGYPHLVALLSSWLERGVVTTEFLEDYVSHLCTIIWFVSPPDAKFVAQRLRQDVNEARNELYLAAVREGIHG